MAPPKRKTLYSADRLAVFLLFFPLLAELFWVADPGGAGSDVRTILSLTQYFCGSTCPGGGPVGGPGACSTTGGGLAVSTCGSATVLVDAQPITNTNNAAVHTNPVAESNLLAVCIRSP